MERDYIISTLSESNKEFLQQIESLESNVKSLDEDVQNLQNRCAQLVNEKAEKTRLLEKEKIEKTKQISEYRVRVNCLYMCLYMYAYTYTYKHRHHSFINNDCYIYLYID